MENRNLAALFPEADAVPETEETRVRLGVVLEVHVAQQTRAEQLETAHPGDRSRRRRRTGRARLRARARRRHAGRLKRNVRGWRERCRVRVRRVEVREQTVKRAASRVAERAGSQRHFSHHFWYVTVRDSEELLVDYNVVP